MMEDIRKKKEEFKKKAVPARDESPIQWMGGVKELHRQQSEYPAEDKNNIFK